MKMRQRVIGVGFDTSAQPDDRFKVRFGHQLGHPDKHKPEKGARVARGHSQRILNVSLHLLAKL